LNRKGKLSKSAVINQNIPGHSLRAPDLVYLTHFREPNMNGIIISPYRAPDLYTFITRIEFSRNRKAFENILRTIESGANMTALYKIWDKEDENALDLIIQNGKNNLCDQPLLSEEQQLTLVQAMYERGGKSCAYSNTTHRNIGMYAPSHLVPLLDKMGVKFGAEDFVNAGNPVFNPEGAVPMMKALLPFVNGDVNVESQTGYTAGYNAAHAHHCEAFRWLCENGLHSNGTYALLAAQHASPRIGDFLECLREHKFPLDETDSKDERPIDKALSCGHFDAVMLFAEHGNPVTLHHIKRAVGLAKHPLAHNGFTETQILRLIDLHENKEGTLSEKSAREILYEIERKLREQRYVLANAVERLSSIESNKDLSAPQNLFLHAQTKTPGF